MSKAKRIVVLGMASKIPVPGVVWQTLHYVVGFHLMGHDVYYVEEHARTPSMFMETPESDGSGRAAAFIDHFMRRFSLGDRWAYRALHDDGRYYGLGESTIRKIFQSADIVINLHGGTIPLPHHYQTGRLVFLETDPVLLQIELHDHLKEAVEFLKPHSAFFTFGENYGSSHCKLPVSEQFHFRPTRQPVILDFWTPEGPFTRPVFTTICNWQQPWREVVLNGETYHWSKHYEFLKFVDLPTRSQKAFELALSGCDRDDIAMLESHGWATRPALQLLELDQYKRFITTSLAEFTVAKDQNIRLRTGWFSDRSATYLASGKPVVTQETGFSDVFPTGSGLFGFSNVDEAIAALDQITLDYDAQSKAAKAVAAEYFSHEVVLGRLLNDIGA